MGRREQNKIASAQFVQRRNRKTQRQNRRIAMVLCAAAVILVLAGGFLLHGMVQFSRSVQVASVGSTATSDGQEQEETQIADGAAEDNSNPYHIDASKPMLALTFDDGPSQYTWTIVDALHQHNARATFFVLGSRVKTHQAAIDYVLANHNEIANHSYGHKDLTKLSGEEATAQVALVDDVLEEQHDYMPELFRLPYGAKNDEVAELLKLLGKPIIGWSVDPYDWKLKNTEKVVDHILNRVQDGDIVLMHDIYETSAEAVVALIPALQEKGFQLVTVSELFESRGIAPEPGGYYRSLPPDQDQTS